ncbi:MAG: exonuclease SbcCD subunit D [Archaeoglobus sp.]|nr:exonuclease SbcCD subunit D [Archaeoglobus sp.]
MVKFVHMADIHLGNKQYGSEERQMDFAQAFLNAIKFAVKEKVDFILIAGDLFHKKSEMDPVTLLQASKVLEIPKKEGIPVIGVEGNHDSTYFRESYSWMDYLAVNGLLINLKPSFDDGKLKLEEWDGKGGAYYDIDGTRIYGMKYYGSISERILEEYFAKLKPGKKTIFMAHIGVEGYVKNMYGCISSSKLHKLGRKVDYIALGHVHKSFVEKNLVFNPGSLEACDISETAYERGVFLVEMGSEVEASLRFDFHEPREFVILKARIKKKEDLEKQLTIDRPLKNRPVVDLTLDVDKSLKNSLNEEEIKELVSKHLNPLLVRVHWSVRDHFRPSMLDLTTKESIEKSVIEQLLENYRYGKIAQEVLRLKNLFSGSFDLEEVDKLVEDILAMPAEMSAEAHTGIHTEVQIAKPEIETGQATRENLIVNESKAFERAKTERIVKEEEEEGEEWDWRKACDTGSRVRKHKKL